MLVQPIEFDVYCEFEDKAKKRIRDIRDWPVLAKVLDLDCTIWTEDQDFFGSGVATWTTKTGQCT